MAVIKCKMCGGDIELAPDKTFGTCEYCGSTMTMPKIDSEQRAAAFNRGNHFRRMGEFDKALAVYERIVADNDHDAEAHWCCALCRFGIEYVEDPATYEYLPTCHRASFDSFLEDVDYLAAVENSDGITRRQYQKDAAKIAEVQKGILATSQNEKPFDVFICYKETDADGQRTRDSLMAQDIYYQLTEQGFRVFFSRITLEDKAGTEYEPYIFAALNSSRVMVVVGTCPEHFNAVWVKNEWSRFLALMRQDRNKLLLPCYRDMDPYDLPDQLSVLQSYNMEHIGFMQDLIRGIEKILGKSKEPEDKLDPAVVQNPSGATVDSLLKRGNLFLEDGDWEQADRYFDRVLDINPECAEAYVGKALATEKCESFSVYIDKLDCPTNQKTAIGLSELEDKAHVAEMASRYVVANYLTEKNVIGLYAFDFEIKTAVVTQNRCCQKILAAFDNNRYLSRALNFSSGKLKKQLLAARAELEERQNDRVQIAQQEEEKCRIDKKTEYQCFLKDADSKVKRMHENAIESREQEYQMAVAWLNDAESIDDFCSAKAKFVGNLRDYKDSAELASQCDEHISMLKKAANVKADKRETQMKIVGLCFVLGSLLLAFLFTFRR